MGKILQTAKPTATLILTINALTFLISIFNDAYCSRENQSFLIYCTQRLLLGALIFSPLALFHLLRSKLIKLTLCVASIFFLTIDAYAILKNLLSQCAYLMDLKGPAGVIFLPQSLIYLFCTIAVILVRFFRAIQSRRASN
jgi:hypothetical protein